MCPCVRMLRIILGLPMSRSYDAAMDIVPRPWVCVVMTIWFDACLDLVIVHLIAVSDVQFVSSHVVRP